MGIKHWADFSLCIFGHYVKLKEIEIAALSSI